MAPWATRSQRLDRGLKRLCGGFAARNLVDALTLATVIGATLVVVPGPRDPEAFAMGRELSLQLFVFAALLTRLSSDAEWSIDWLDILLLTFVALSVAAFVHASVRPYAMRSMGLIAASAGLWFIARATASDRRASFLTGIALVVGAVVAAVSWIEALGWIDRMSAVGRGPGGLFGHRNRMAQILALCLPVVLVELGAWRSRARGYFSWSVTALVVGMLVLSRSRSSWVASLVACGVLLAGTLRMRLLVDSRSSRRVLLRLFGALAAGVCAALFLPSDIAWRSAHPYRDSLKSLVDMSSGSGRARVVQLANTGRMIVASPLLGVGPGNWQVEYPRFASSDDPSLFPARAIPTNRLPSSAWTGIAAENGLPALITLALFLGVAATALWMALAWQGAPSRESSSASSSSSALGALAMLAAVFCTGFAEPVLMTPAPAALFFASLALAQPEMRPVYKYRVRAQWRSVHLGVAVLLLSPLLLFAARQCYGDYRRRTARSLGDYMVAARWNPGDFASRVIASDSLARRGKCETGAPYAIQAYRLNPASHSPLVFFRMCPSALSR